MTRVEGNYLGTRLKADFFIIFYVRTPNTKIGLERIGF
jgi:hypothetical protein